MRSTKSLLRIALIFGLVIVLFFSGLLKWAGPSDAVIYKEDIEDTRLIGNDLTLEQALEIEEAGRSTKALDDLNGNNIHDSLENKVDMWSRENVHVIVRFDFARDWDTFRYKISPAALDYLEAEGAEIIEVYDMLGLARMKVPANKLNYIAQLSFIDFIEGIPELRICLDSSLPAIRADQNTLNNVGVSGVKGEGQVIAILDTGIYGDHDAFSQDPNKIVGWKDYMNGLTTPYDDHGHGTHCASIAAGDPTSGNYIGVALKAQLVGVKVMDEIGSGSYEIYNGMQWCLSNKGNYGISVMSMSLGTMGQGSSTIDSAVSSCTSAGMAVIAAAGNEGPSGSPAEQSMGSPARAPAAITVGSCQDSGTYSTFSTWGVTDSAAYSAPDPSVYALDPTKPDVTAPGEQIWAANSKYGGSWTNMGGQAYYGKDTPWVMSQGTSMACPHVAGVVGLMFQMNPSLTPSDCKDALKANTKAGTGGGDGDYRRGWGMVQVAEMLLAIGHPPSLTDYGVGGMTEVEVDEDESVTFSASATDEDGYIDVYQWDFNGDLQPDDYGQSVSHSFPNSGIVTVTVWAVDNDGLSDKGTIQVGVVNLPPDAKASISSPTGTIYMDEDVTLTGTMSTDTPSDQEDLIYRWDLDGDGEYDDDLGEEVIKVWDHPGEFEIGLEVMDDDDTTDTDTLDITVVNKQPTASARLDDSMEPGSIYEDDKVFFDGSESSDTASDINNLDYMWDFNDRDGIDWSNPDSTKKNPSCVYELAGSYVVSLKVMDPHDSESIVSTLTVTVYNVEPAADISGISNANPSEGDSIMADGSGSTDSASDVSGLNYTWDFDIDYDSDGDGVTDNDADDFGQMPTFKPVRDGEITMKLTVTDDDGDKGLDYFTFNVTNSPPRIKDPKIMDQFGNELTEVFEGETITLEAVVEDVVTDLEIMQYEWEFDENGVLVPYAGKTIEYTPKNDGYLLFSIYAKDNMDRVSKDFDDAIFVKNAPPEVVSGVVDKKININEEVTFELEVEDSENDMENLIYTWGFGDGKSDTTYEPIATHKYGPSSAGSTLAVKVEISDGTDTTIVRMNITVNNPPAALFEISKDHVNPGEEITLDGAMSRDTDGTVVEYLWDLDVNKDTNGDGIKNNDVDATGANPSVSFDKSGDYYILLTVKDNDGATGTKQGYVKVKDQGIMSGGSNMMTNPTAENGGLYLYLAIILIVIFVVVVVVLLKKRKDKTEMEETFFNASQGGQGQARTGGGQGYAQGQGQGYQNNNEYDNYYTPAYESQQQPEEKDPYQYTNYEEIYGGGDDRL